MARISETWPGTSGKILNSGVTHATEPYFFIFEKKGHKPDITYIYSIDNIKYVNNNLQFTNESLYSDHDHLHSTLYKEMLLKDYIAAYYPPNKTVNVKYNPDNPGQSILETSNRGHLNSQYYTSIFIRLLAFLYILYFIADLFTNRKTRGK